MIAIHEKSNGVRLIATIMVMAMIVAGVAVVFSDSNVNAATTNNTEGLNQLSTTENNGAGWTYTYDEESSTGTLTLNGYNGSGFYSSNSLVVVVSGENTITGITNAVASSDNGVRYAAIYTTSGTLTIQGDDDESTTDKLTIDVTGTTTGEAGSEWTYGVKSAGTLTFSNVAVDIDVAVEDKYAFATSAAGNTTFTNVTGTIDGGNRAVQVGNYTLTITGSTMTFTGGEKAIQAKNENSSVVINGNSKVEAFLDPDYGGPQVGDDDGYGIKATNLSVEAGSTLVSDGIRITSEEVEEGTSAATFNGNVTIRDYSYAFEASIADGVVYVPGFTVDEGSSATINENSVFTNNAATTINGTLTGDMVCSDYVINGGNITADSINALVGENTGVTVTLLSGSIESLPESFDGTIDIIGASFIPQIAPIVIGENTYLNIVPGKAFKDANFSVTNKTAEETTSSAQFVDFGAEGLYISYGSVAIGGAGLHGTINVSGDFEISCADETVESGAAGLTINAAPGSDITIDEDLTITGAGLTIKSTDESDDAESVNVLIQEGISIDIDNATFAIGKNVRVNNYGDINGTGTIDVDGYFYSAEPVEAKFTGDGEIDLSDAMEDLTIYETLASSFVSDPTQKVVVRGNLTITSGKYMIVTGDLEIVDGYTVTIEDGGLLMVDGAAATANIYGNIVSKGTFSGSVSGYNTNGAAGFTYADGKEINVYGDITAKKSNSQDDLTTVSINGKTNLEGNVTVDAKAAADFGEVTVASTGSVTINGKFTGTIYNQGTVTINGTVDNATVYMNGTEGTVLNITALKGGKLTVSDSGLYLQTLDGNRRIVGQTAGTTVNSIELESVRGVTVTEGYSSVTENNVRTVYNNMFIAGTLADQNSRDQVTGTMNVLTGTLTVSGELTISDVSVTVTSTLNVTGTVYVTDDEFPIVGVAGSSDVLKVSGLVRSVVGLHDEDLDIQAVMYEQIIDNTPMYFYTNLADAIASGEENLTVLGDLLILEDTTIPDGVVIDADGRNVQVGSNAMEITGITLTVADGGMLIAGSINVEATMVIENTDTGIDCNRIISDVSSENETTAKYTNIYTALSQAQPGETVTITKTGTDPTVYISRDVTVGDGVTLVIPARNTLSILEGVTLTIDGTLDNRGTVSAHKEDMTSGVFGTKPVVSTTSAGTTTTTEYAVIAVNGTIVSVTDMPYGVENTSGYNIAGAYYIINGRYYITTVENSAEFIADSETGVTINGQVEVGDVAFIGTSDEPVSVIIASNADISAASMTITNGTIVAQNGAEIDGTYGSAVGTIVLENMAAGTEGFTIQDTMVMVGEQEIQTVFVSGKIGAVADTDDKIVSTVTFNGDVAVRAALDISINDDDDEVSVASDATVAISGSGATVSVKTGSNKALITIEGTVSTADSGSIVADVAVLGTLDIKERTENTAAGTADIGKLYVAGTPELRYGTDSNGAVNGTFLVDSVFAFSGSTIADDTTSMLTASGVESTEFYVEGELWMTVYDIDGSTTIASYNNTGGITTYNIKPTGLTDSVFVSWQNSRGVDIAASSTTSVSVGDVDAVYANINYDIYKITVFADPGISAVYIDGKLMTSGYYFDQDGINLVAGFQAFVSAGSHEITYKLGNYYSGEANMTVNGEAVTGNSFSCSGTSASATSVTIYLQGIEASAPETPSTPSGDSGSDDGMGLTDYLLIVLIILIVIMAIMVAIRLMRS